MSAEILKGIESLALGSELACADAHELAAGLGVVPGEVGRVANTTAVRISRCQLGLFGYGSKAEGKSKIVLKATNVPEDIGAAIESRAVNGALSCLAAWEIAAQFKYPRLGIANIAEALGLRIKPCQLGCF
jgi:hypothetical protein